MSFGFLDPAEHTGDTPALYSHQPMMPRLGRALLVEVDMHSPISNSGDKYTDMMASNNSAEVFNATACEFQPAEYTTPRRATTNPRPNAPARCDIGPSFCQALSNQSSSDFSRRYFTTAEPSRSLKWNSSDVNARISK